MQHQSLCLLIAIGVISCTKIKEVPVKEELQAPPPTISFQIAPRMQFEEVIESLRYLAEWGSPVKLNVPSLQATFEFISEGNEVGLIVTADGCRIDGEFVDDEVALKKVTEWIETMRRVGFGSDTNIWIKSFTDVPAERGLQVMKQLQDLGVTQFFLPPSR
jgi:hypothetical protein